MTIEEAQKMKGTLLIGSRGLGVGDEDSDYDIAIKLSDLNDELLGILKNGLNYNIEKYFKKLPLGNAWLIPKYTCENGEKIDWIIFEDFSDFDVIKESKEDLSYIPKYIIKDKFTRIHLFEKALEYYGFIERK